MQEAPIDLQSLENFIDVAVKECYLSDFLSKKEPVPERENFFELVHSEGDWHYRDSFTGFYISIGQEIVRYKGRAVWGTSYSGGMREEYIGNLEFFGELETFLRKSLSIPDSESYQPRGPERFEEGDWRYECKWEGDIKEFHGLETIYYKDEEVFYHRFMGGLIIGK